jgi:hypothetical protein
LSKFDKLIQEGLDRTQEILDRQSARLTGESGGSIS